MNILFWSGGKDAYLALQLFRRESNTADLKLLTTYDETSGIVPHQKIEISSIREQANALGLNVITVPLPPECPNEEYLKRVKEALSKQDQAVEYLIFGDWKLEDIRKWREEKFEEMGYKCLFPIWEKSLHELLPVLWLNPITIVISNVREEYRDLIRTGETYNQSFVTQIQRLKEDIDPMGENGEFHTRVIFKDLDEKVNLEFQTPDVQPLYSVNPKQE